MSTMIHGGSEWKGWASSQSGDGAVTISGEVATLSSGITTGSAKLTKDVFTQPGEVYELTFMARRVSGVDGTSGSGWIDWPGGGTLKTRVEINSDQWAEYTARYAIPLTSNENSYTQFGVGVYTALGGQIEVCHPRISVDRSPFGALRSVAHGLLYWDGTTLVTHGSFSTSGIISTRYDAASKSLFIKTKRINLAVAVRPLAFVQMTPDGAASVVKLVPKVGSYNTTTGEFTVRFIDTTTGAFVDIAGLALYFFFKAVI